MPLHDLTSIDDDMPPLVDNTNPALTYTFYSEMTPLSFPSTNPPSQSSPFNSNPPSPLTPDDSITPHFLSMSSHTRSHGKRRDPSYIPRPSNAFILFRSAFIRDRKVSDKVEGNHSSLSKIIGHSWKKLSPHEREKWEAEAVAAQAQHRAMYPDWRFRPGANALAKLKVKDGGTTTPRRRSARVKDPPDETLDDDLLDPDHSGKGKEKAKITNRSTKRMLSLEELRCAKIADFVADGIRGEELEVAVKQWEGDRKMGKKKPHRPRLTHTRGESSASANSRSHSSTTPTMGSPDNHYPNNTSPDSTSNPSQVLLIDAPTPAHERRDSISFPIPSGADTTTTSFDASQQQQQQQQQHLTWQDAENRRRMEEMQEPNSWWGDSRSAEVVGYHETAEHSAGSCATTTEMGYENSGGSHFDSGYVEYGCFDSPHDGSQNVEWTDMSNTTDRRGLATLLETSYKDSGDPNSPHTLTPPTIYAPPLSNSYYYSLVPPATSPPLPPSSFSTLTGWAGDYKIQTSSFNTWPDHSSSTTAPASHAPPPLSPSSASSPSNWYSPDGTLHWGGRCPSLDSQDWDRLERRAANDLHLAVEPLPPMTFQSEICRLHGSLS